MAKFAPNPDVTTIGDAYGPPVMTGVPDPPVQAVLVAGQAEPPQASVQAEQSTED